MLTNQYIYCPFCLSTKSKNYGAFSSWQDVAMHARFCEKNLNPNKNPYIFDNGIIPVIDFQQNYSSNYIRYLHPTIRRGLSQIRKQFTDRGFIVDKYNSNTWNKDEMLQVIKDFYEKYDRIPLTREFIDIPGAPKQSTYRTHFGSWNSAIEAAGYSAHSNIFGVKTKALDGILYKSSFEASFVNEYLIGKHKYLYEVKYPIPFHRKSYDFYLPETDLYIELAGGTSSEYINNINIKININKELNRSLLIIYPKDLRERTICL